MSRYAPRKGMSEAEIRQTVTGILAETSLQEKVAMMSGRGFVKQVAESRRYGADPYRAGGGCERLGVPALYFTDGPRGAARGSSTCFPCAMARGATFDTALEQRVGEAMAVEMRAQGCNLTGAVCVNLLRHPAWGRAQETYAEDPCLLGEMGSALARGLQTHNVVATVKHFAANSIENARFKVDVRIDERTLREVYLPHFKRILDSGCATVMSAYNKLNGAYCGHNRELLTSILRQEWGFTGFVHSDWFLGLYGPEAVNAGLDVENPEPVHFGERLIEAVADGRVDAATIDTACRRILTVIYRFACAEDPLAEYPANLVASPAHIALAHEVALKSAVLLKNEGLLPLHRGNLETVALLGRLADLENTGDFGSSQVQPPYVVTPLRGLTEYLGDEVTILRGDESDPAGAARVAAQAEVAIVIAGYTAREEGEYITGGVLPMEGMQTATLGGDRDDLRLPPDQVALIEAVSRANPRTLVVLVGGSAIVVREWIDGVTALLQTFYSGMEGGRALARLLFGEVSPSAKLPFTIPNDEAELPPFDKNADRIEYGPWHGYTLFEHEGREPAFAFGFGLSYVPFSYRALKVRRIGQRIEAQVSVRNDGNMPADEIVQLYVGFPGQSAQRPRKLLRAFDRVTIASGATVTCRLQVSLDDLRWWNPDTRDWELERGTHRIHVGGASSDARLLHADIEL